MLDVVLHFYMFALFPLPFLLFLVNPRDHGLFAAGQETVNFTASIGNMKMSWALNLLLHKPVKLYPLAVKMLFWFFGL